MVGASELSRTTTQHTKPCKQPRISIISSLQCPSLREPRAQGTEVSASAGIVTSTSTCSQRCQSSSCSNSTNTTSKDRLHMLAGSCTAGKSTAWCSCLYCPHHEPTHPPCWKNSNVPTTTLAHNSSLAPNTHTARCTSLLPWIAGIQQCN